MRDPVRGDPGRDRVPNSSRGGIFLGDSRRGGMGRPGMAEKMGGGPANSPGPPGRRGPLAPLPTGRGGGGRRVCLGAGGSGRGVEGDPRGDPGAERAPRDDKPGPFLYSGPRGDRLRGVPSLLRKEGGGAVSRKSGPAGNFRRPGAGDRRPAGDPSGLRGEPGGPGRQPGDDGGAPASRFLEGSSDGDPSDGRG